MRFAVALLALVSTALAQSSDSASASRSSASASRSEASASRSSAISSGIAAGSSILSGAAASASAALQPCALNCIVAAAGATECNVPTNFTCACTNADFQAMANSCLTLECKPDELGVAMGLQAQQCAALSLSATARPTATAPFTPSNPAMDISGSPSASNSASGNTGAAVSLLGACCFFVLSFNPFSRFVVVLAPSLP
ncbi:CFEM domain-containing protein [Favolaschia claudopus]|uniref:CFEM domain-containing protein n=1 Tax=Favolaschia claudopus TaxID=2862362 RepID=A0AAW0CZF9_9AGAR